MSHKVHDETRFALLSLLFKSNNSGCNQTFEHSFVWVTKILETRKFTNFVIKIIENFSSFSLQTTSSLIFRKYSSEMINEHGEIIFSWSSFLTVTHLCMIQKSFGFCFHETNWFSMEKEKSIECEVETVEWNVSEKRFFFFSEK